MNPDWPNRWCSSVSLRIRKNNGKNCTKMRGTRRTLAITSEFSRAQQQVQQCPWVDCDSNVCIHAFSDIRYGMGTVPFPSLRAVAESRRTVELSRLDRPQGRILGNRERGRNMHFLYTPGILRRTELDVRGILALSVSSQRAMGTRDFS